MLALQMERDESEQTVARYTMGAGLEAMHRDGESSFYHYNHLGTALALTGANEAVTDTYRHDAWGVLLASTGSTVNPHTYVGRERYYRMPGAEMYHLGFRDYAQGIGRFMTVDRLLAIYAVSVRRWLLIPGRTSVIWFIESVIDYLWQLASIRYGYCSNQPTRLYDPSGLQHRSDRDVMPISPLDPPYDPWSDGPGMFPPPVPNPADPPSWLQPWEPPTGGYPAWTLKYMGNRAFQDCLEARFQGFGPESRVSPCWAHYLHRESGGVLFPDLPGPHHGPEYTEEACREEDACVCAVRQELCPPPGECENVREAPFPPGIPKDPIAPWPR